jgi:predicted nucleic acid-binding protein
VVILTDSSAWIEFMRRTGSDINVRVRAHMVSGTLGMTEVVVMELLAGARSGIEESEIQRFINGVPFLPTIGLADYQVAAALYRACRRGGETVRKMNDCLIAAVAIRNDVPVLHHDADFDILARYTPLRVA